jgi:dTDP-4-amino-4,6-dideoxygalactose transaminase
MNYSNRREFGKTLAKAAAAGFVVGSGPAVFSGKDKPALAGGSPIRTKPFPSWPEITEKDDNALLDALHSKKWCRLNGNHASRFEGAWSKMLDAKYCLATSSGTTALFTVLNALDIGPGDEVIVPSYTFVATINVVLLQYALPVFVDTDRETFQIDANKIEAAITPRTRVIMPVHLGGNVAELDKILTLGKARNIPIVEDACQAHLAEWRGKKVSTLGVAGCFSFQASKNLCSGEGGAILTNDDSIVESCRSFHNNGRGKTDYGYSYVRNGSNHRMTEFQAALLSSQVASLEQRSRTREQNAQYLTGRLEEISGITPARMYGGCTRNAYHLYMFRYNPESFSGLSHAQFLKAMQAEGIPASAGYAPLNKEPAIENTISSRHYRKIFSEQELKRYRERIECPENDKLCKEAVWLTQTMLLGTKADMDDIVNAILKVQRGAATLAK